jgi:hypothetical protein
MNHSILMGCGGNQTMFWLKNFEHLWVAIQNVVAVAMTTENKSGI